MYSYAQQIFKVTTLKPYENYLESWNKLGFLSFSEQRNNTNVKEDDNESKTYTFFDIFMWVIVYVRLSSFPSTQT